MDQVLECRNKSLKILKKIINEVNYPIVVDADGLNILSKDKDLFEKLPKESILTPHIGEFKRFAGNFENSNEKDNAAKEN